MKTKLYLSVLAICIIAISSCKKFDGGNTVVPSTLSHSGTSGPDVYVAGYYYAKNGKTVAVYWKNGLLHKLSDSTLNAAGEAIALHDTDVYVSGTQTEANGSLTAVYWINGHKVILDHNAGAAAGEGIVVTECGCDVYVVGTVIEGTGSRAVYWKNGVQHRLPGGSKNMEGNGITLHGKDVYVAGLGVPFDNTTSYAFYYKNDSLHVLTDSTTISGQGQAIIVKGNDVYVAGASWVGGDHIATVWKNGVATLVGNTSNNLGSIVTGLAVKGNDTYTSVVLGTDASFWLNNTKTDLTPSPLFGNDTAIVLSGNDVYISGWNASFNGNENPAACYWKNGVAAPLTAPRNTTGLSGSAGLGIAVAQH